MVFIILTELTGCYTTKNLPVSDINSKGQYLISGNKIHFDAHDVSVSDSLVKGYLYPIRWGVDTTKYTHIYLLNDSSIVFTGDEFKIPIKNILKIETPVYSPMQTAILISAVVLGFATIIVVALKNFKLDMGSINLGH